MAAASAAQYKWIDSSGRVNYSDRLPPHDAQRIERAGAAPSADGDSALPYALRQAVSKYPVSLYTSSGCEPCDAARAHLIKRGVPFTEFTVRSSSDADAYRRAGFDGKTVPGLKVGRQIASGYEPATVTSLLDAAGYPKTSALPSRYARPTPKPLTAATPSTSSQPLGGDGAAKVAADDAAPVAEAANEPVASSTPTSSIPERIPAAGPNPNFRF